MNIRLLMTVFIPITGISLLVACGSHGEPEDIAKAAPAAIPVVKGTPVLMQRPGYTLLLPGQLMPYEQVTLYARIRGFVKTLYADRGSVVHKGQLLALLDAPELEQQYLAGEQEKNKAYTTYLLSRQLYERIRTASQHAGAVAAAELDRAQSKMQQDSAAYAAAASESANARQIMEYRRITAPFDGVVTARQVSTGALAGNGETALFNIAQVAHLRLTVSIPGKHAQSVNPSSSVHFTVEDQPGRVFDARLSRSSRFIDEQDQSLTVEFDVNNRYGTFTGGEYAQVSLTLQRADSTCWVPLSSLVNAQSGHFVVKINPDQTLSRVEVRTGVIKDNMQEVFGALTGVDQVVLNGSEELPVDQKVTVH